jgi:DNA modification methylase
MSADRNLGVIARPEAGQQVLLHGDSSIVGFQPFFDLVLTSPPYFHPRQTSHAHGLPSPFEDLDAYADWVARILQRTHSALKPGRALCFVKTDVKYKGSLLPVGFEIARACVGLGMPISAHWIWKRMSFFSPYAPSLANIFVLGHTDGIFLQSAGLFQSGDIRSRSHPSSFTPHLFELLIRQLTVENDIVLDPFAGVGSTTLAAARAGRWSVGVELCPTQLEKATINLGNLRGLTFRGGFEPDGQLRDGRTNGNECIATEQHG